MRNCTNPLNGGVMVYSAGNYRVYREPVKSIAPGQHSYVVVKDFHDGRIVFSTHHLHEAILEADDRNQKDPVA